MVTLLLSVRFKGAPMRANLLFGYPVNYLAAPYLVADRPVPLAYATLAGLPLQL